MATKRGKKQGGKVKNLPARSLSAKQAKGVKGGIWVQRKLEPASANLIEETTIPVVKWEKR